MVWSELEDSRRETERLKGQAINQATDEGPAMERLGRTSRSVTPRTSAELGAHWVCGVSDKGSGVSSGRGSRSDKTGIRKKMDLEFATHPVLCNTPKA